MRHRPYTENVNGVAPFLQAHKTIAFALPPPSETWTSREAPDPVADRLRKLQANHIIEIVERRPSEKGGNRYRTRRSAYRFVREQLDEPTRTPCRHSGVRNLGDGQYTCSNETCGARFGRETAREVLS